MNHPQTTAKTLNKLLKSNIKENIDSIEKYACCALTALWCFGVEPDNDLEALETINDAINAGVIDKDCTVKWAEFGRWISGREVSVDFVDIKNILSIKDRTPVRFDYKGNSHWVGVEKGKVVFNALEHSTCVELGRPVTSRVLHIKGVTK